MDVDHFAVDRPVIGERLHAIDERDDAVGFVADQLGQLTPGRIGILLQQLRRAANSGKRVLDLMSEHCRHPGNRTRGIPVGQVAVHHLRHRALVQGEHEHVRTFARQRSLNGDQAPREARALEENVVLGDRIADPPHRGDERQQGAVRRHEIGERTATQRGRAGSEKLLGGRIDEADATAPIDNDYGKCESCQDHRRVGLGYPERTPFWVRASAVPKRRLDHAVSQASSGS